VALLLRVPEFDTYVFSCVRSIIVGAGPSSPGLVRDAREAFGAPYSIRYSSTESGGLGTLTALDAPDEEALYTVGRPRAGIELEVRDEDGNVLPPGEAGEVCLRSGAVMAGYWNDPEATAATLRDGWLWTGDLGAFDADGFLTLKDRSKDLIVSGGSNIYPREVEEVLLMHPNVAEASVVGRPDPEWGEAVVAFVVARGEAPAAEQLDRLCLDHIARFKRPREYRFVESLPKNNYGKVVKTDLRAALKD
jgi:long-chain acyl-CoA synthetase